MSQGVADYARQLLYLDAQRRLHPYVERTEENFKIVTLDASGSTKVVAQHGSKPVRIVNQPNTGSHSSAFRK